MRAERAVSWTDVGVIGAWHASIIGIGFYGQGSTFFGVAAILLAIAAFWVAIWQLVSDGARRMQATMSEFERLAAQQAGSPLPPDAQGEMPVRRPPFDDGDGEDHHRARGARLTPRGRRRRHPSPRFGAQRRGMAQ